jgi:predicted SAM-dependent methyltransferase
MMLSWLGLGRKRFPRPLRLHVGSGSVRLAGWVNVDAQALPGVDVVADVTQGLEFRGVEAVFAEHFLEHLPLADAIRFLLAVHGALADGGWLRLSTPNLDWVWITHYRLDGGAEERRDAALRLNRAFHGWRHQFLWNREMLASTLAACGFDEVRFCQRGESALPVFQGLERHETYQDNDDFPHLLVAEARKGKARPDLIEKLGDLVERDYLVHLSDEEKG